jgi:hypothetical protein
MDILDQCCQAKFDEEATTRKDAAQCTEGRKDNPQSKLFVMRKIDLLTKYIDSKPKIINRRRMRRVGAEDIKSSS